MIINLSFKELFGPGSTQTAAALTISKADLPTLTPTADNNGQELFVGILLRLWELTSGSITTPSGESLNSPTGEIVTYDQSEVNRPTLKLWRVIPTESFREIVFEVFVWL